MKNKKNIVKIPVNFNIGLSLITKNGKPAIELRRVTEDLDTIKIILNSAISEKPILIYPTFRNKMRGIATLCEKNILKYSKDKNCYEYII